MFMEIRDQVRGINAPFAVNAEAFKCAGTQQFAQIAWAGAEERRGFCHGHQTVPLQQDLNRIHILYLLAKSGFRLIGSE